jgi:hypothetical protein
LNDTFDHAATPHGHGALPDASSIQRDVIASSMARWSSLDGTGWPILEESATERASGVVCPCFQASGMEFFP